jgi:hypothetical protein
MKASKRRARARANSKSPTIPTTIESAFSESEEAFFREGAALAAAASSERLEVFADLEDAAPRPPGLWRRIVGSVSTLETRFRASSRTAD